MINNWKKCYLDNLKQNVIKQKGSIVQYMYIIMMMT